MLNTINLTNKKILIIGYAMTGKTVANFLLDCGAQVTINDRGDLSKDPSVHLLLEQGAKVVDKGHPLELLDTPFDFIVKNPGIPYTVPLIEVAEQKGIPIYTDVELAYWFSEAPFIGITGSNGKTTITSLIHQILAEHGNGQALLAGNIGVPSLDVIRDAKAEDDVVIELSSFQLMGTEKFKPEIAVICNIYEAHLDYHGSRDAYIAAKLNIAANLTPDDYLVYNYDQVELSEWLSDTKAKRVPFAMERVDDFVKLNGAYLLENVIYFKDAVMANLSDIQIPGSHNVANVLAAVAVAGLKDVSAETIQKVLRLYGGMPHRIQQIAASAERLFYNDSKATNMVATEIALKSFQQPVVYIGGGLDRGNAFDELIPYLSYVKAAYLYGETKEKMATAFNQAGVAHVSLYEDLAAATTVAYHAAQAGDVVLFSPSCASWDQYKTYEVRGDHFVETVHRLIETSPYQTESQNV